MPPASLEARGAVGYTAGVLLTPATFRSTKPLHIVVYVLIALILASLASALVFVVRDRSGSKRAVKALAVRVGLSITLFLLLMAGHYFGFIPGKL